MIEVKTRQIGNSFYYTDVVENEFLCPECGRINIFYSRSQTLCDYCDTLFPNISKMLVNQARRIGYFLYGDTYV
jgi:hypothetical protein